MSRYTDVMRDALIEAVREGPNELRGVAYAPTKEWQASHDAGVHHAIVAIREFFAEPKEPTLAEVAWKLYKEMGDLPDTDTRKQLLLTLWRCD